MRIEINNRQSLFRADKRKIAELAELFLEHAQRLNPRRRWRDLSVALVDDVQMGCINEQQLGHAGATDVISFNYAPMPGEEAGDTGDVVVNVQRAWQTATQNGNGNVLPRGWSASHELALYVAHGCDHLADQGDATPRDRQRMRARELRWVRKAEALQLIDGLTSETQAGRQRSRRA